MIGFTAARSKFTINREGFAEKWCSSEMDDVVKAGIKPIYDTFHQTTTAYLDALPRSGWRGTGDYSRTKTLDNTIIGIVGASGAAALFNRKHNTLLEAMEAHRMA